MTVGTSTAWRTTFAVLVMLSGAVLWGSHPTATKILFRPDGAHFDAVGLVVARGAWSLPCFLTMLWLGRPERSPTPHEWRLLVATGLAFATSAAFLALAVRSTSVAHVALLNSLTPPITAVLGALALRERVPPLRIAALVLAVGGALLLALTRSTNGSSLVGDAFVLVQVIAIAAMFITGRALGARFPATFTSGVYGAVAMGALLAVGIALGRVPAAVLLPLVPDASAPWWFFGVIVLGITVYAQYTQAFALRTLGAVTTSILGSYATLVFALVFATALLHERVSPSGVLAGVLIAAAIALALVPARRSAA